MASGYAPTPYPAAPRSRRPSPWWWVAGGLLILGAIAALVIFLVLLFETISDVVTNPQNTTVSADGAAHSVVLTGTNTGYIWAKNGTGSQTATCSVTDATTGAGLALSPVHATTRIDDNGTHLVKLFTFPVGSGHLSVTCRSDNISQVLIGPDPPTGRILTYGVLVFVAPGALGLAGLVILIVTLVRTLSRPKPAPFFPGYAGPPPYRSGPPPYQSGPPPIPGAPPTPGAPPSHPGPDQDVPPTHTRT